MTKTHVGTTVNNYLVKFVIGTVKFNKYSANDHKGRL